MEKDMRVYDAPRGLTHWTSQRKYAGARRGEYKMTKLSLSKDVYSRKSLKRKYSYENNQEWIDVCSVYFGDITTVMASLICH